MVSAARPARSVASRSGAKWEEWEPGTEASLSKGVAPGAAAHTSWGVEPRSHMTYGTGSSVSGSPKEPKSSPRVKGSGRSIT